MRRSINTWSCVAALAVLSVGSAKVYGDDKWYDAIAIGGHIQGSYVAALGKDIPRTNQLHEFDENNGFNLNQAQLRISKPVGDDGYGFGMKLLAGNDAETIHSNGLGVVGSEPIDLQEAYVNMAPMKRLTLTGGKFVTTAGVEVIESPLNLTIEPGLLFFYGLPFTHTGVKAGYALGDNLSVMAGVVNGWDQVQDTNPGKTMIFQVAATPLKAFTANLTGTYGPELSIGNNASKRSSLDLVVGFTGIEKLTLNAEALWGQDTNVGGTEDSGVTPWTGFGLWAGMAMSNILNPGVRFEVFKDESDVAVSANRRLGGVAQTAKSFTLVNKFITSKATFARLQYRYDWSSEASYTRDDGTFVTTQKVISADWVVTF